MGAFGLTKGTKAYSTFVVPRVMRSVNRRKAKAICVPSIPHPVWLRPATTDWVVMEQILIDQAYDLSKWPEHERAVCARYERAVQCGQLPVIVDCGAHIGMAAVWFGVNFPSARVVAVEPALENFEILQRNAQSYPNITPIHAAISDSVKTVSLLNREGEPWAWETREAEFGDVRTVTIPGLLNEQPNTVPLIVKIDIEGGEVELFRSNCDWVERTPLIVVELHDWQGGWRGTGHAVFSKLSTHRRDYMQRGENIFSFGYCALRK
jgi:FkbM family methyltransferase